MPVAEFITAPGKTASRPGEVLTGILVPSLNPAACSVYYKVGKRRAMAIAVASLAAVLEVNAENAVASIRLAWGSVGPTVLRLPAVEKYLTGRPLTAEVLQEAGRLAFEGVAPIGDVRAEASYRRHLAGNLLLRLNDCSYRKGG
jgi:xanthine dehydrogenase FAD-binding subunit